MWAWILYDTFFGKISTINIKKSYVRDERKNDLRPKGSAAPVVVLFV
jgi:hypothetical protein